MNRRSFFKKAALGAAVVAAAPAILSEPFMPVTATLGSYADYANFSDAAIKASIDELVEQSAVQLGYQAGMSINKLYEVTFDEIRA